MTKKRVRTNDTTRTARIADFVRGQSRIDREMFLAAFPAANAIQLSLLTALGYITEGRRPGNPNGVEALRAYAAAKRPEWDAKKAVKRREKVAKLEAKIAALREQEAAQ